MLSVLVVSLNAGADLLRTVESALNQKDAEFEVVVKDGGSTDGSIQKLPESEKLRVVACKDTGIYNAMNQAVEYANGDWVLFLNCGDTFYDQEVLSRLQAFCQRIPTEQYTIVYGDCYTENRDLFVRYPDVFDDYVCLTKTLCHQATVYPRWLLQQRGFQEKYKIAADYECYVHAYANGCKMVHIPEVVVRYQGNGASESPKNLKKSIRDADQICRNNLGKQRYKKVRRQANLRGFGIKRFMVRQAWFYPVYKKLARLYHRH